MPENLKGQEFKCNATIICEADEDGGKKYKMVAAIGNRFMNGGFLSAKALKDSTEEWNGTLHDINHMGIGAWEQDIRFFVGWHDNANYNQKTKALTMDVNVDETTVFASAWQAYIGLCEKADRTPNVSVTYKADVTWIKASKLPVKNLEDYGLNEDDIVPFLENIIPIAVSTVVIGRCDDKAGCGLKKNEMESCACDSCKCKIKIIDDPNAKKEEEKETTDEKLEKERKELIEKVKTLEDKLGKGD